MNPPPFFEVPGALRRAVGSCSPRLAQRVHDRGTGRRLVVVVAGALLALCARGAVAAPDPAAVWLESETPSAMSAGTLKPNISDWGKPTYLSGGKWMAFQVDADKVDQQVPAEGILLTYRFDAPTAAAYQLWNRIGFERVRSPFDWRLDGGDWTTVTPQQDTLDVEELGTWSPVAWLKMGEQTLTAGQHTLEIRVQKSLDAKGKTDHLNYSSDALYITPHPFYPDGPHQPGTGQDGAEDRAARNQVFQLPENAPAAQTPVALKGNWEMARDDEAVVQDRTGAIPALPDENALSWHSLAVPSNRTSADPEQTYVHRYFLRTHVNVPASLAGRSLYLHLPSVSLMGTAFVNGQPVGFTRTPYAVWDMDITRAVTPGQVNEIVIGIKDPFYGLANEENAKHLEYTPYDFWHYNTTNQLDFPILGRYDTGILQTPYLVVAGDVYTSDAFAMPSVTKHALGLELTLHNGGRDSRSVQLQNAVEPLGGGAAEKTFAPQTVDVAPGQDQVVNVTESWPNPHLWWPDDPHQYVLVTRVLENGQPVDERRTKFGFREWDWNGPTFRLNGVPFHGRADLFDYDQATEAAVAAWHKHGMNMERVWGETSMSGMEMDQALDFFDSHGVPVRRTGIFDGEGAAGFYNLTEDVRVNGQDHRQPRRALFDNWEAQLVAWVKSQRNHPSIFIWSMENEITFINSHVFGNNPITDPEMRHAADLVAAVDPTRPQMVDGGNALIDESLPVYGGHYMEPPLSSLPAGAYDKAAMAHRQQWPITQVKPILLGEAYFLSGIDLSELATVGGEAAFVGKAESHPAGGLAARMLSEGYRWNGISFHFWFGGESDLHYIAWQPTAVLCREWNWTFGSGTSPARTLGVFNDTRSSDPITLKYTLHVGSRVVDAHQRTLHIPAGGDQKFTVALHLPSVDRRTEGTWDLALFRGGKQVFHDVKAVSILPPVTAHAVAFGRMAPRSGVRGASTRGASTVTAAGRASTRGAPAVTAAGRAPSAAGASVYVYDPAGQAAVFLTKAGVSYQLLKNLDGLPAAVPAVLVLGKDALTDAESTSSRLAAWATAGRTLIVLDQAHPLRFQALPGEMTAETNTGDIAFLEDASSPVLQGLENKDFFSWGTDGPLFQDAYVKPTSGGKSLIECNTGLQNTALAEMQAGKGDMLLCQLRLEERLPTNVVAQRLLLNMIRRGQTYRQVFIPVQLVASAGSPMQKALDRTGLRYTAVHDLNAALPAANSVAVVDASPENLHALAANPARVAAFTRRGGWLILNNLTPEGLADYNKLVGWNHIIRPFRQEKVSWPVVRSPLTAGLATSNIVMGSGKRIFNFAAGEYPDTDAFSYVVDYDEVAPFASSSFFAWNNIVNNYTMADGFWPLIINFPVTNGKPYDIPIKLARPEKVTQLTWVSDLNYAGTTRINLQFPGGKTLSWPTQPNGDPQTFDIKPPVTADQLTLQIADWQHIPAKQHDGQDLVGADNIYIKVARPPSFYESVKPLLNIGAMMEYPKGKGGIVLCNVKFKDTETVPENALKKQTILATMLRNLHAPFSGGKVIIAGASNLTYTPVSLAPRANQYLGEQGWFGDRIFAFTDFPLGHHLFGGVPYDIYDFKTSPVPSVIMLGGNGIPNHLPERVEGIPVNQKADALFFLQAARIDQRRNRDELKRGTRFEMADYIVHYADGQTATVPVYSEISVDNYHQELPTALPGAQVAWSGPLGKNAEMGVAYSMQWNNPQPDVAITSVDLVYGPDRRGVPALLGLTAARAK